MSDKFENIEDGINLKPLSSDPTNPKNGDIFFSDGTPRATGLWARISAAWTKFISADSTDTLTNKTFDADGTGNVLSNVDNANIKAAAAIDAEKIHDGTVTNTEFGYLNGVTSALQTQIDAKTSNPMNASGDIIYGGASGVPTRLAKGTDAKILTLVSGLPSWESPSDVLLTIQSKTANYTVLTTDDLMLGDATGGVFTFTLPTAVGNTGVVFRFVKTDSSTNRITIEGDGAETINGLLSVLIGRQYDSITIASNGTSWNILQNNLSSSARYNTTAGQTLTTGAATIIDFGTVVHDAQSCVSTGAAWKFTAKHSGIYLVNSKILFAGTASWDTNEAATLFLQKNSVDYSTLDYVVHYEAIGASKFTSLNGMSLVYLAATDYVQVFAQQGSGANNSLSTSASHNYVEIVKVY